MLAGVREHEGVHEVVHSPAHERRCSFADMTPLRVVDAYEDDLEIAGHQAPRLAEGAQVLQAAGILEVRRKLDRIIEVCDVDDMVVHLGGHSHSRVADHLAEPVGATSDLAHEGGEFERIDVLRCVHADAGDAKVPQVVDVLPEGVVTMRVLARLSTVPLMSLSAASPA